MLTPILKKLKTKLKNKGYSDRTKFEDELLDELEKIDESDELEKGMTKIGKSLSESFTAGPLDKCPCCGK